jgi:hypothetical protein
VVKGQVEVEVDVGSSRSGWVWVWVILEYLAGRGGEKGISTCVQTSRAFKSSQVDPSQSEGEGEDEVRRRVCVCVCSMCSVSLQSKKCRVQLVNSHYLPGRAGAVGEGFFNE